MKTILFQGDSITDAKRTKDDANIGRGYAAQASYTMSKDLHKAYENNSDGIPIYNGQVVTVEGVVTVATGV